MYNCLQVFGFCAMVAYGVDAFFKLKAVQNGELAQGERIVNKQTSTVTSPGWTVSWICLSDIFERLLHFVSVLPLQFNIPYLMCLYFLYKLSLISHTYNNNFLTLNYFIRYQLSGFCSYYFNCMPLLLLECLSLYMLLKCKCGRFTCSIYYLLP